ncbi:MAG TPA: DUF2911 domain-containing protein [Chryseolinea sp.]
MKKLLFVCLGLILSICTAQSQSFRKVDKSPLDYAYFPDHFAHDRKEGDKAIVRVTYSRPAKNGREVFGKLVPYGKVWRTGANENTEIKLYQDVEIGGKQVPAGTYSLFSIPGEKEWTIILNRDLDYWGAYKYNEKSDVVRVTAPATTAGEPIENFSIQFEGKGEKKAVMKLGWDTTLVEIPVKY